MIIQRSWRGFRCRYLQINEFNQKVWQYKRSRLLNAIVKGYKTRLLLNPNGYYKILMQIKQEIYNITNFKSDKAIIIDVKDKLTMKNLMKRRKQKVIEFIRIFNKAFQTQGIIFQLLIQKKKFEKENLNK